MSGAPQDHAPGRRAGYDGTGPRIVLHLGAHKTASTHLQNALARARPALARHGVALFGPAQLRRRGLGLIEYLAGDTPDPPAHAARLRAALALRCTQLLLSDENILGSAHNPELITEGRFYPRAEARLRALAALLPEGRVTIAMAIRNPASFLVSAYAQRVASGILQPFEDFVAGLDPARLRWSELIGRMMAERPAMRWVVWRYEDYPGNAPDVLRVLAGPAAGLVRPGQAVAQPGLSGPAQARLMAEAPALSDRDAEAVRARVAALRARWPKGAFAGFDPLADRVKRRSARAYARDQARIAALPGLRALWAGAAEG